MSDTAIRNVSDTALWVAIFRARESDRSDAHFRDPFARALAGDRGEQIARSMPWMERASWSMVARTVVFDEFIARAVAGGADMVVNLAAGLDTRPYRMALPPSLQWVEIDLPAMVDYKSEILRDAQPRCRLERIKLDLSDSDARREVFRSLGARANKAFIVSEGLLIYLGDVTVRSLAADLAAVPTFRQWAVDIASPGLLKMMRKEVGSRLDEADAPFLFAPPEGPQFFESSGWKPVDVRSMLKTAAKLKRLTLMFRLFSMLPEKQPAGSRPWSGVCLLERT